MSHKGAGFEAERWKEVARIYCRAMGMALERKVGNTQDNGTQDSRKSGGTAGMLRKRVRYFTDGAVIGSKAFVNEAFAGARERFTVRRRDGARKMR